jgi:hypothetical protein
LLNHNSHQINLPAQGNLYQNPSGLPYRSSQGHSKIDMEFQSTIKILLKNN